jgi:hypothetical protein
MLLDVLPCSPLEVHTASIVRVEDQEKYEINKTQTASRSETLLVASAWLATCLAQSSLLNMKAVCSSETLVNFYHVTTFCIPEIITLEKCEVLFE